jgi:oligopeptidase B
MKQGLFLFFITFLMACNQPDKMTQSTYSWPEGVSEPKAAKKPIEISFHGDTRTDEYYWLREKENPEVIAYLNAENSYLDSIMSGLQEFRNDLFNEMKGRIKEKDESVPAFENGYYYYQKFVEGKEYYIYCRRKSLTTGAEEILLDVNQLAEGHPYYAIGSLSVSPNNKLLAFGVDTVSRRQYTIHIKNLETGEIFADAIPRTTGQAVWAADNKTFFYTENNPQTLLTEKIKRHRLGTMASSDAVVYHEKDNTNYIGVMPSRSRQFIFIRSSATLSSEYRFIPSDQPDGEFKLFQARVKNILYKVEHQGNRFLVVTNWEAKNFRLMETPLDKTTMESWKEKIAHRDNVLLQSLDAYKDYLVMSERKNGLVQIRIMHTVSGKEHHLAFDEPAYTAQSGENREYNSSTFRFIYTSLTTPVSTYDYNMASKEKQLMKRQEVVGGYDPDAYVTERVFATATDGTQIPVSIVYKKGYSKDGTSPLLLYGYGSYGYSLDASFSSNRITLLDRGFAYAIAHIRGGQEMGRQWYDDGKMFKKKNTFTDFISCAEFLVEGKYTSPAHLYAMGGSAGGLLMGAVVNMRPDLWNGVVAVVPFVDVVTTMLDESIPLTTNEFDEWGNPKNKDSYDYMKSYSPYDNIEAKAYPNLLIMTGLHDSQVQYWEPAKWMARLREKRTNKNLLMMHTDMETGHGGASGRFDYLKDIALQYAFLLGLEGTIK